MSEVPDAISERIALTVHRARVRSEALAGATGLSRVVTDALVRCKPFELNLGSLFALVRVLGCSPDWLLGLSADGRPSICELRRTFAVLWKPARRRASTRRRHSRPRSVCLGELTRKLDALKKSQHSRSYSATSHLLWDDLPDTAVVTRELGIRLSRLLLDAGIARSELARATGLAPGTVDELCRGRRKDLSARELRLLARTLGCSAAWLLGAERDPPKVVDVWSCFVARGGQRRARCKDAARLARGPEDLAPLRDLQARHEATAARAQGVGSVDRHGSLDDESPERDRYGVDVSGVGPPTPEPQ